MRILFVTATRVGDAVLSTGLLSYLIEKNPGARVTVACGPAAAGLFEAVPGLEQIIVLRKKKMSGHWLDFWKATVGTLWNQVIDLRNSPATYLVPHTSGFHIGRKLMDGHRMLRNAAVLGLQDNPPAPRLWTSIPQDNRAAELLPEGGPIIALGPVSNWKPKTWAAENFVDLVKRLTRADGPFPEARVAVFGADDEREQAAPLLELIPPCQRVDLMGVVSLPELYACLKRTQLFVGNDSGLMHMAAAAGIPTLGLFGPSREQHYAPWGDHCRAVRGDLGYEEIFPLDYDYRNSAHHKFMADLSVDRVEQEALSLLSEIGHE
jgi:heptosyltransferase III